MKLVWELWVLCPRKQERQSHCPETWERQSSLVKGGRSLEKMTRPWKYYAMRIAQWGYHEKRQNQQRGTENENRIGSLEETSAVSVVVVCRHPQKRGEHTLASRVKKSGCQ